MLLDNKLIENIEDVKNNLEKEESLRKIREEVLKRFDDYRNTLNYMVGDAPLQILCLPSIIESALLAHGCLRVYDLFDCDFTKVKGMGIVRIRDLTARLDQFFAML